VVGRTELLAAAGRDRVGATWPWGPPPHGAWAGAGALYLVALLSKETVALLPAVVLWLGVLDSGAGPAGPLRSAMVPFAVLAGVGADVPGLPGPGHPLDAPDAFIAADNTLALGRRPARAGECCTCWGRYAGPVVAPISLCSDHTYGRTRFPRPTWLDPGTPGWVVGLAGGPGGPRCLAGVDGPQPGPVGRDGPGLTCWSGTSSWR